MLAEERHKFILKKINIDGSVRTLELSEECNASYETIRKDLYFLSAKNLLHRVHGGAILKSDIDAINKRIATSEKDSYISFDVRNKKHNLYKKAIALEASKLIEENYSIGLDSGTTSFELAKIIIHKYKNLTVLTNSLKNACVLVKNPNFRIIVTGGVLTYDEHSFVSDFASLILEHIHLDVMFLTGYGISLKNGITDQRIDEVRIHNKMRLISKKTFVLADNSKFGNISLVHVCNLNDIDGIITDDEISQNIAKDFIKNGCNIITSKTK